MFTGLRTVLADRTNRHISEKELFNIAEYEEMDHDDMVIDDPSDDGDEDQDNAKAAGHTRGLRLRPSPVSEQPGPPKCAAHDTYDGPRGWRYRQSEYPVPGRPSIVVHARTDNAISTAC